MPAHAASACKPLELYIFLQNDRTPDAQLFMNATYAFDSHKAI